MQQFCSAEMYNLALQGIMASTNSPGNENIFMNKILPCKRGLTILYGFDSARIHKVGQGAWWIQVDKAATQL